jgi:hypothetical protein
MPSFDPDNNGYAPHLNAVSGPIVTEAKIEVIEPDIDLEEYFETREAFEEMDIQSEDSIDSAARMILGGRYIDLVIEFDANRIRTEMRSLYHGVSESCPWIDKTLCALIRNPYTFFREKIIDAIEDDKYWDELYGNDSDEDEVDEDKDDGCDK